MSACVQKNLGVGKISRGIRKISEVQNVRISYFVVGMPFFFNAAFSSILASCTPDVCVSSVHIKLKHANHNGRDIYLFHAMFHVPTSGQQQRPNKCLLNEHFINCFTITQEMFAIIKIDIPNRPYVCTVLTTQVSFGCFHLLHQLYLSDYWPYSEFYFPTISFHHR